MTMELVEPSTDLSRAMARRWQAAAALECPSHWLLDSPGLTPVLALARRIAKVATMPIVIQGERGCGVQELARLIHDADPVARSGRFRTFAAQSIGPTEMRGTVQHGTLFLEDIENLRPTGQHWLLEVLSERDTSRRKLRVIVSSRFSVTELLRQGQVRQELIHVLDVSRLAIPALRDRPGEILLHAQRLLRHYGSLHQKPPLSFDAAAERKLLRHAYPANLSELRNVIERAVALCPNESDVIGESAIVFYDDAGADTRHGPSPLAAARRIREPGRLPSMREVEKDYLVMLIREFGGRRTAMARAMGVSYPTVLKKIARHRLDVRAIVGSSGTDADEDPMVTGR